MIQYVVWHPWRGAMEFFIWLPEVFAALRRSGYHLQPSGLVKSSPPG